jgi:hypothetical protein
LGYLIGPSALVEQLDKVRPPYNISVLNCECALFALEHQDVFAVECLRAGGRLIVSRSLHELLAAYAALVCPLADACIDSYG